MVMPLAHTSFWTCVLQLGYRKSLLGDDFNFFFHFGKKKKNENNVDMQVLGNRQGGCLFAQDKKSFQFFY